MMTPQTPAEGISLRRDFGDSKFYQIDCTCGNDEDSIEFEVTLEVDKDMNEVALSMYTTQTTDWWTEKFKVNYSINNPVLEYFYWKWMSFWNGLYTRLRLTKNIWIDGQVKYQSATYMTKQQTLNFAETLKTALPEVEVAHYKKKEIEGLLTENMNLKKEINLLKKDLK
jgi:hypothetical protein